VIVIDENIVADQRGFDEAAMYARRFLRHRSFRTQAQRMGKIIYVRPSGISWWEMGSKAERALSW